MRDISERQTSTGTYAARIGQRRLARFRKNTKQIHFGIQNTFYYSCGRRPGGTLFDGKAEMRMACYSMVAFGTLMTLSSVQPRSNAGEPVSTAPMVSTAAHVEERLAGSAELDAINLSMIDRKLALSLTVEIHVQIELLEYSLGEVHDAALKRLLESKRQLYCSLLNTLNDLTGGRAATMLDAANGKKPQPESATDSAKVSHWGKGGVRAALQNATDSAILRVRLEIARQYTDILRTQLQACPPADFDCNFMAADLVNQMQAVAILRVFEHQASEDFAKIIRVARAAAEGHLNESRQLVQQLDSLVDRASTTGRVVTATE
ncbi:MAG: hypothetical protein WD063_10020 [Pirellulales bacterium]